MISSLPASLLTAFARCDPERRFDTFVSWATRVPRTWAWCMVALSAALVGIADGATGGEAWFGPLYLLVICLATWAINWRAGVGIGIACVAVSVAVNGLRIYPLGEVAIVWNLAMRVLAVLIIIVLIGSVRRSFDREWARARSDALTGLLNKQAFLERCTLGRRHGGWGILAYVDLDGLKPINDRYGHAAGDQTLRAFADGVRNIIRSTDVFARIGGDEFLLFVPVGNGVEGSRIARTLHSRMNRIPSPSSFPIRCSMGVIILSPDMLRVDDDHIQMADRLMYEAKQEGAAFRISTEASARLPASLAA